jgi:hypothetical protein
MTLLTFDFVKFWWWPRIYRSMGVMLFWCRIAVIAAKTLVMFKVRQWFHFKENVKLIQRNKIEISYKFRDAEYRIRSRVRRGPVVPIRVEADGKDVTEELLPYIGPGDDFHGITYSPQDFGYSTITVRREGNDDLVFDEFDTIRIPQ